MNADHPFTITMKLTLEQAEEVFQALQAWSEKAGYVGYSWAHELADAVGEQAYLEREAREEAVEERRTEEFHRRTLR